MTHSPSHALFVMAAEGRSGKSLVALGLVDALARRVGRVGVFRPVVHHAETPDEVIDLLAHRTDPPFPSAVGVTYDDMQRDGDAAMASIVERYHDLAERCDAVVVVGSDFSGVASPIELSVNGHIAANLGVPVVAVVSGKGRQLDSIVNLVDLTVNELRHAHAPVLAVVVNRVDPDTVPAVREHFERLATRTGKAMRVWVVPEDPLVAAPQIVDALAAVDGTLIAGDDHLLDRLYFDTLICAMNVEHMLGHLEDGQLCIAAGDRADILVALAASCASADNPSVSAVVLTGGFVPDADVARLIAGIDAHLPLISTRVRLVRHRNRHRCHQRPVVARLDTEDRPGPRHLRRPPRQRRRRGARRHPPRQRRHPADVRAATDRTRSGRQSPHRSPRGRRRSGAAGRRQRAGS